MKPTINQRLVRLIVVTVIAALAFWVVQKDDIFSFFASPVVLSGSVPEAVRQSTPIHHAAPETVLEIVVGLKVRDEAALDGLILRQQDPASPDYQRFISVADFTQRFAPTSGQVDAVTGFLTTSGIAVKQVYANHLLIHAVGTVAQLEKAFNVTINEYPGVGGSARGYYSNDRDPTIPGNLKNIIQSVIGLNTLAEYQSRMLAPDYSRAAPHGGSGHGPPQPPVTPQDIATAYDLPNPNNAKHPAHLFTGKGVNLAIATARGYDKNDVETFWKTHNVVRTGTVTDIPVNGGSTKLEGETTLDLEQAGSQAPGANILMYVASSPAFVNFTLVFGQVVVDNKADIMTVSWGLCEERTGWVQMLTESLLFREAAVQGIALFASAGDDGAYDCKNDDKHEWRVDYPSSSPHVTAVGGTSLHVKNNERVSESAWSGGGGGVSSHWNRPVWQQAPALPAGDKRVTTDVSMNADPWTGYSFFFNGKWGRIGGTSASAPEWASFWALVTEATGQRVGSANYYVYRIGALQLYHKYFYDVTTGNNGDGVGPGYKAASGWDIPTGWGVPDGEAFTEWMAQVSPKKPSVEKNLGQQHPGLMFSKMFGKVSDGLGHLFHWSTKP